MIYRLRTFGRKQIVESLPPKYNPAAEKDQGAPRIDSDQDVPADYEY